MAEKKRADPRDNNAKPKPDVSKRKPQEAPQEAPKKKGLARVLFKLLLVLIVLLMLGGAGVAAGVYFKLIDVPGIAQKYKLHTLPVVGRYIPQPATNFEQVDLPEEPPAEQPPAPPAPVAQDPPAAKPPAATPEELKEQLAKTRQEQAKRISRLARLYGEMKPDEAVPILNQLDDPTVLAILNKMEDGQAAKILALFDARRAARLSQDMLKGKTM